MGFLNKRKMTLKETLLKLECQIHKNSRASKIIYYHDINDENKHQAFARDATSFNLFKRHLEVINSCGFTIVDQITKPEGELTIGFDDGWAGILDVKDYLFEKKIYPTISIAPGLLNLDGYLTSNEVKVLHQEGCRIICHTWTHQSITLYNNYEKALRRELCDSKKFLEDLLSEEIDTICYPQGRFSFTTYEKALEYGYKELWTCIDGNYYDEVFPLARRRNLVQHVSEKEMRWVLLGPNKIKAKRHFRMLYTDS